MRPDQNDPKPIAGLWGILPMRNTVLGFQFRLRLQLIMVGLDGGQSGVQLGECFGCRVPRVLDDSIDNGIFTSEEGLVESIQLLAAEKDVGQPAVRHSLLQPGEGMGSW